MPALSGQKSAPKQNSCGGIFDLPGHREKLAKLDKLATEEGFWDDQEAAQKILKEASTHRKLIEDYDSLAEEVEEFEIYLELFDDSPDEAEKALENLVSHIDQMELAKMLSGRDDDKDCIITIKPGAGGTESQDWAQMLFRLYTRYLERREYKFSVIDLQPGTEAGIKEASIEVSGDHPFGYLKAETGVHRLVRISPFDSNARRHTSFASVFVLPDAGDIPEIELDMSDVRVDTFRSSGAGGQHVNKTDSAIRLTHFPSGLVVSCQNERSQHKNRDAAIKMLKARLYQRHLEEEAKKRAEIEETKSDIGWGNQIRSYVFHPYKMVKDLRTGVETSNVDQVMDGDIHQFITEFLLGRKRAKHGAQTEED
jgi:peptide chain release factor 2